MGFVIYTYPKGGFDAIESSMCHAGFTIAPAVGRGGARQIAITKGIAQAEVVDFSEAGSETLFVVMSGRKNLFTALAMWPIDVWLGRAVERYLVADGASMLDPREEEANQSAQPTRGTAPRG